MNKLLLMGVTIVILSFPTIAAAEEKKEVPEYLQKKYDRRVEDIKAFDANKDGVLQTEELQKSSTTKFDAADVNKDGVLSSDETAASLEKFKTDKQGTYGKAVEQKANRLKNRYKNADKDDDGQVSKDEYQAYMGKHQQNFDRNGDGVISKEEYRVDDEKVPSSYLRKQEKGQR